MATRLNDEIRELLANPTTVKVLATQDKNGVPHAVARQSLQVTDDDFLLYDELYESSRTNKNLVYGLWYDKQVSIAIYGASGRTFQIRGIPVKSHITGPLYQKHYRETRHKLGDTELAAVWIIEPLEVIDENHEFQKEQQEREHPFLKHLDRIARTETNEEKQP